MIEQVYIYIYVLHMYIIIIFHPGAPSLPCAPRILSVNCCHDAKAACSRTKPRWLRCARSSRTKLACHRVLWRWKRVQKNQAENKDLWLVVGPPLWKIWKSVGMIRNPIYGKIKNGNQTTNQTCRDRCSADFSTRRVTMIVMALWYFRWVRTWPYMGVWLTGLWKFVENPFVNGLVGNTYRKPWFLPSNLVVSCILSHHPILWLYHSV